MIGIDVGGTKIRAGIVKNKRITKIITERVHAKSSKNKVLKQIIQIIEQLFNSDVKGIGIGVPAIVDPKTSILYESVNIKSWVKVPLKKVLEKKFKVPVIINNDANCFVLGEKLFGKAKRYSNIVGLIIGTGVGAGIIINRKLYSGHDGAAGEFGKIPYQNKDIEYYCSGKFFKNKFRISGEALFQKALKNNSSAKNIFKEYGKHLGNALSIIINAINPEIIVIGGSVSKAYKFFGKIMRASLKKTAYKKVLNNTKITVSDKKDIAVLGAASLFYQK